MDGTKRYEFRRTQFKQPVKRVYVYATAPVQAIIGYFDVDEITSAGPSRLWSKCKQGAGVSRNAFEAYFAGAEVGHAIGVKKAVRFPTPQALSDYGLSRAPQSFQYL